MKRRKTTHDVIIKTLQFKLKCVTGLLDHQLTLASQEVNRVWNHINVYSYEKITNNEKKPSSFDLHKIIPKIDKFKPQSEKNPHGLIMINQAVIQRVNDEYTNKRDETGKSKMKFRRSFAPQKNNAWIPFKQENINISYPYIDSIFEGCGETSKQVRKNMVRVGGKNVVHQELALLPYFTSEPIITVLGTRVKIFNPEYLKKHLLMGASIRGGSLKQNNIGQWFLNFVIEIPQQVYREHLRDNLDIQDIALFECLGVDCNLSNFCTDSEGQTIPSPKFYRQLERAIAKLQSTAHDKQSKRMHLKVKNQRRDFINKLVLDIVRLANNIYLGDLDVQALMKRKKVNKKRQEKQQKEQQKNHSDGTTKNSNENNSSTSSNKTVKRKGHGKSYADQGIGMFKTQLSNKCNDAGRSLSLVDESYTTCICSNCDAFTGPRGLKQLHVRAWTCSDCQTTHDRDVNSAKNMCRMAHIKWLIHFHRENIRQQNKHHPVRVEVSTSVVNHTNERNGVDACVSASADTKALSIPNNSVEQTGNDNSYGSSLAQATSMPLSRHGSMNYS